MPTMWIDAINRSSFYTAIEKYFREVRGITSSRKIDTLTFRWIRQKGYRLPMITQRRIKCQIR